MNLNTNDWKEFNVGELFEVSLSSGDLKIDDCDVGDAPLISSGSTDNGIVGYIKNGDSKAQLFSQNKITVDMFCNAFYQYQDFYSVSHGRVNILTPKFKMNTFIALFIVTLINKESFKYSYGRAVYSSEISRMVIKLPVDVNGNPNWQFMEDYINSINSEPITTKNKQNTLLNVETKGWKEYKLGQLFNEIYKADAHVKNDIDNFEHGNSERLEFITRTDTNNGCDCFVNKNDVSGIEKGNAIIIGDTTSTIYYQANNFVAGDHIVVCRADWINKYTALFLKTLLEKERYRYSYGRAFKMDLIKSTIVNLPTKNNEPDWEYMENYIKSLPYGDRI